MEFATLAAYFARLEATSKRLATTAVLVEALDALDADEVAPVAYLVQGKVAPDWHGIELGLAEKMVLRVITAATGIADATALYQRLGDLGRAAEVALGGGEAADVPGPAGDAAASGPAGAATSARTGAATGGAPTRRQATLFGPQAMSVRDVYDRLRAIAAATGTGSQDVKQKLLAKLLADASPLEARYIIRTVAGRLRLGVADMTFLDALAAWHLARGVRSVQDMEADERSEHEAVRARLERAYDRTSDLATVADALARSGMEAVDALDVSVGVPLRPMAAERCKTLAEILERQGGRVAAEYKYDGLRVQAHVTTDPAGRVRLFSRRLEELTAQFPDVQAALRAALAAGAGRRANRSGPATAIVEGEIVAVDADGALLPFQAVSRRRGRKRGLAGDEAVTTLAGEASTRASAEGDITSEVPVAVFLFDALAVDGRDLLGTPYEERRAALAAFAFDDRVRLSTMQECADEAALEAFFHAAVAAGAEGMMCKAPTAPYKAGNRGYDWIKFKTDYTAELVDTLDLVVIGAFFGRGRRAGWYGALLMACYDADANVYRSVCKLGTGFDDATLVGLRGRFAEHESAVRPPDVDSTMKPDVWLRPAVVMEVQAAEITVSPVHRAAWDQIRPGAGLAARFPRFSGRWRDDKRPTDATTVDELRGLYEAQASRLHPNR